MGSAIGVARGADHLVHRHAGLSRSAGALPPRTYTKAPPTGGILLNVEEAAQALAPKLGEQVEADCAELLGAASLADAPQSSAAANATVVAAVLVEADRRGIPALSRSTFTSLLSLFCSSFAAITSLTSHAEPH